MHTQLIATSEKLLITFETSGLSATGGTNIIVSFTSFYTR